MMNKRILISGFEPFDGDTTNPSSLLLDWLSQKSYNFSLETQLLPVSFTNAYSILSHTIDHFKPDFVIMTGFAKKRKVITIEKRALNFVDARIPDNDGLILKNQKIINNSTAELFTTLSPDLLLNILKLANCEATVSEDAGEYVCNYLMYKYLSDWVNIPGTFIHIPGVDNYESVFNGIDTILKNL